MYRERHLEGVWRGLASRCKLEAAYALGDVALNLFFFFLTPNEILWKKNVCSLTQEGPKIYYAKLLGKKPNLQFNQIFKQLRVKP